MFQENNINSQPNPKHQCILVAVKSNFICNECKKSFQERVSMKCSIHEYDICIECYSSLSTIKQTQQQYQTQSQYQPQIQYQPQQ